MNDAAQGWIKSEISLRLRNINAYLESEGADYALKNDDGFAIAFEENCGEKRFVEYMHSGMDLVIEDTKIPDEYRYGRLIGRLYHAQANPSLYRIMSTPRVKKVRQVGEHLFAQLHLRLHDTEYDIEQAIDEFSTAKDPRSEYCILDEPIFRKRGRGRAGNIRKTYSAGFDMGREFDAEQAKLEAADPSFFDLERKKRDNQEFLGGILPSFGTSPSDDVSLDYGAYGKLEQAAMGFGATRNLRAHDAFYAALSIRSRSIDGTDNSIKTAGTFLISSVDEALLAAYQILRA